jgi:hypothetical protein
VGHGGSVAHGAPSDSCDIDSPASVAAPPSAHEEKNAGFWGKRRLRKESASLRAGARGDRESISPTVRILNLVAKTGQAGNAGETSMPWASTATAQALRLSSGRSALGGLPGPRQKVGSVAQTETTGEPRQHVGKVRDGVDLGEFAAGEDRVGNGSALSAGI